MTTRAPASRFEEQWPYGDYTPGRYAWLLEHVEHVDIAGVSGRQGLWRYDGDGIRTLTLWQPWASLVALGVKTIETRSWSTRHRGPLYIHAAARHPTFDDMRVVASNLDAWNAWMAAGLVRNVGVMHTGPLGAIVARCTVTDVYEVQ